PEHPPRSHIPEIDWARSRSQETLRLIPNARVQAGSSAVSPCRNHKPCELHLALPSRARPEGTRRPVEGQCRCSASATLGEGREILHAASSSFFFSSGESSSFISSCLGFGQ